MEITFAYDKKLVIQALRYHFIGRTEIRVLIILVNVFAIFAAALLYFRKVSPLAFLLSSILWIGLMASIWIILPYMVYNKASTFKDSFKLSFGNYQLRLENERGYTEWAWDKISSYYESPHFIHLYFDSRSFFLVPKAAIERENALTEVRELLHSKIGRKK